MSAPGFRSVFMVASCAGAALTCYLVSLNVASERAALEDVETRIVLAQRDLRVLQTEIGTRGRLAQLERWNVKVLALSAPTADQFLSGSYELAKLAQPQDKVVIDAPVVLASAPAPDPAQPAIGAETRDDAGSAQAPALSAKQILNQASLKTGTREVPARPAVETASPAGSKSKGQPVTAAKPVIDRPSDRPGLAAAKPAQKKSVDKPTVATAKPVTKPARLAKADPLGALPAKQTGSTAKDSAPQR